MWNRFQTDPSEHLKKEPKEHENQVQLSNVRKESVALFYRFKQTLTSGWIIGIRFSSRARKWPRAIGTTLPCSLLLRQTLSLVTMLLVASSSLDVCVCVKNIISRWGAPRVRTPPTLSNSLYYTYKWENRLLRPWPFTPCLYVCIKLRGGASGFVLIYKTYCRTIDAVFPALIQ